MRLLLVGGGHSHVLALRGLGLRPDPMLRPTIVTPGRLATYSGMVPGAIAGIYPLRAAQIDLERLAERAGAACVVGCATGLDPARRVLTLGDGTALGYDLVSFDIGSAPARTAPIDPDAPLVPLKPIDEAVARLERALAERRRNRRVVVVGAGAAGTEVACALAARLRDDPGRTITLCDRTDRPLVERGPRAAALAARALTELGIGFRGGVRAERVSRDAVHLDDGSRLESDLVVWATGAGETSLFADAGLPTDARGGLCVTAELRCPSHPEIFAAGDCAALIPHPDLPKAGVYAVRQAPVLEHNLRAAAAGRALQPYRPQPRFLALLNTCDGRALLSYGSFAWRGRAAWWLKDWIDRRFVGQFG